MWGFCTESPLLQFLESHISIVHTIMKIFYRLSPLTTPPVEKTQYMNLTLQEILIVGSATEQVKFSELTMDMFRMIQTLEREPQEDFNHIYDASPAPGRMPYGVPGQKGWASLIFNYKFENVCWYLLVISQWTMLTFTVKITGKKHLLLCRPEIPNVENFSDIGGSFFHRLGLIREKP